MATLALEYDFPQTIAEAFAHIGQVKSPTYELWAASIDNADAADLLRASGREETDHGNRLLQAAASLEH